MISSFIDGRVRIRCDALRNPEAAAAIEGTLRETPGVLSATANPRTGGLLVEYDPEAVTQEQLLEAAKMLDAFAAQEQAAPKKACCDCSWPSTPTICTRTASASWPRPARSGRSPYGLHTLQGRKPASRAALRVVNTAVQALHA